METEGTLKTKMEELKAFSAKKTEMELMIRLLKMEIETSGVIGGEVGGFG